MLPPVSKAATLAEPYALSPAAFDGSRYVRRLFDVSDIVALLESAESKKAA